jgi:hypothetical protein
MQVPNRRLAAFWIAVPLGVVLAVAMASVLFNQGNLTDGSEPQAKPAVKVTPAKVESLVRRTVTRQRRTIRFRVVDADGDQPVSVAVVVIDINGEMTCALTSHMMKIDLRVEAGVQS